MHDNIVQFAPAAKAERASVSSIEAASEVSASTVVQFSWGSKKRPRSAGFPKMAVLTGGISTDISLNEGLRKERNRKWHAASAKAEVLRAMMNMHNKLSIAQNYQLPEVRGYPPADPADYWRLVEDWRKAVMDHLLTPAPDVKSLMWKRQKVAQLNEFDWVGVKPARVEKAIAADEAFLKTHPTRHCRHRPPKEAQAAEIVEAGGETGSEHRP